MLCPKLTTPDAQICAGCIPDSLLDKGCELLNKAHAAEEAASSPAAASPHTTPPPSSHAPPPAPPPPPQPATPPDLLNAPVTSLCKNKRFADAPGGDLGGQAGSKARAKGGSKGTAEEGARKSKGSIHARSVCGYPLPGVQLVTDESISQIFTYNNQVLPILARLHMRKPVPGANAAILLKIVKACSLWCFARIVRLIQSACPCQTKTCSATLKQQCQACPFALCIGLTCSIAIPHAEGMPDADVGPSGEPARFLLVYDFACGLLQSLMARLRRLGERKPPPSVAAWAYKVKAVLDDFHAGNHTSEWCKQHVWPFGLLFNKHPDFNTQVCEQGFKKWNTLRYAMYQCGPETYDFDMHLYTYLQSFLFA